MHIVTDIVMKANGFLITEQRAIGNTMRNIESYYKFKNQT